MTLECQNQGNPTGLDLDKEEALLWEPAGEKEELAERTEEEESPHKFQKETCRCGPTRSERPGQR